MELLNLIGEFVGDMILNIDCYDNNKKYLGTKSGKFDNKDYRYLILNRTKTIIRLVSILKKEEVKFIDSDGLLKVSFIRSDSEDFLPYTFFIKLTLVTLNRPITPKELFKYQLQR